MCGNVAIMGENEKLLVLELCSLAAPEHSVTLRLLYAYLCKRITSLYTIAHDVFSL